MENINENLETNNPGNSEAVTETENTETVSTATETSEGATSTTGNEKSEKSEFADPNMQKAWTEKTQALAEERRKHQEEYEKWNGEKSAVEKQIALLKRLDSDPEIVDFIYKKLGVNKQQNSAVSESDYYEAQSDPNKLRELIQKEATRIAQGIVSPISHDFNEMKFETELANYANMPENKDFWDLDKSGLIEPQITYLKSKYPNASAIDLINKAHAEARRIEGSIKSRVEKEQMARASATINEKKNGSIDKGGKSKLPTSKSYKGKTLQEVADDLYPN